MIENLSGIHETVNYQEYSKTKLYNNDEAENYPPHWHIPYEIIMPLENTYRAQCGQTTYDLREGDVLIICPGILHELFAPRQGVRIIFQSDASLFSLREIGILGSIISPAILITPEDYPQVHGKIRSLLLRIREEYAAANPYSESLIYAWFLEILVLVGRHHTETVQHSIDAGHGKQKEYFEKFFLVCNYISEHFAEELTLEQVAGIAGFSKYHFTRLFRQYAGTSFYKYLNQKRIAHAKNLLYDPELSVIEVALASGFSSLSAFLRMFRLMNNCTPTEFRRMYDRKSFYGKKNSPEQQEDEEAQTQALSEQTQKEEQRRRSTEALQAQTRGEEQRRRSTETLQAQTRGGEQRRRSAEALQKQAQTPAEQTQNDARQT